MPSDILKRKKLKIGFNPKVHTQKTLNFFFNKTNCKLHPIEQNLIQNFPIKQENVKQKKFYVLPKAAVGQNYKLKINKLLNILKKKKIEFQFISASENIAWLLNIRGKDSEFTPIPNAYLSLDSNKKINLFCDLKN